MLSPASALKCCYASALAAISSVNVSATVCFDSCLAARLLGVAALQTDAPYVLFVVLWLCSIQDNEKHIGFCLWCNTLSNMPNSEKVWVITFVLHWIYSAKISHRPVQSVTVMVREIARRITKVALLMIGSSELIRWTSLNSVLESGYII